ncbi:MAG TPA: NADH-ubiquinone oxidoreductase-F iron-sulfur binding region domain-containing protein [Candidatus Dormibacteraeota bacterium]|nr:NADH-ubiquinone oxidoreductase-F iron-sulfur binding region domain-containing protein [Candidatus Dormibacteraeota bacterium]
MSVRHSIIDGPALDAPESLDSHLARLGHLPTGSREVIDVLDAAGLRGRGGAAFPVATKWRAVAERSRRDAVVLVNGAEGEPLSAKDRLVMETRPHLVLDGALLAARTVRAREVVVYVGEEHRRALAVMQHALGERSAQERRSTRVLAAPARYVAGEESAAVHFVNEGVALPTTTPPRVFERGVAGRPTLVQNVETLAHVALAARHGGAVRGTALLTLSGAVPRRGVLEVAEGSSIGEALGRAGGPGDHGGALLLGGYFGGWVDLDQAAAMPVDAAWLRSAGMALGCGVVAVLPASRCGVAETARILGWLAEQSARQCGPCVFGLRAIAEAVQRIAERRPQEGDLHRVERWSQQLAGRGACKHPDGAAALLQSALRVFAGDFTMNQVRRTCVATARTAAA